MPRPDVAGAGAPITSSMPPVGGKQLAAWLGGKQKAGFRPPLCALSGYVLRHIGIAIGPVGIDYGYLLNPPSFTSATGIILRQPQGVIHIRFGQTF